MVEYLTTIRDAIIADPKRHAGRRSKTYRENQSRIKVLEVSINYSIHREDMLEIINGIYPTIYAELIKSGKMGVVFKIGRSMFKVVVNDSDNIESIKKSIMGEYISKIESQKSRRTPIRNRNNVM